MGMPKEKPKNTKASLARIFAYIGKNKNLLFGMLAVMLIATLLNIVAPSLQQKAIDTITLTDESASVDFGMLITWLSVLGGVYLVSAVLTYFQNIFAAKLSQYTVRIMRSDLFSRISRLPIKYMDTHKHGDIMSRMTNDVENVSNSVSQSLGSLVSGIIMLIGCFVMMLVYSWQLTLISMITIVLTLIVSKNLSKLMRKFFPMQQAKLGQLNGQIEEAVSGYKTVKAYTREKVVCDDFNRTSDQLKSIGIKAQILGGSMGPCMNCIGNIGFLLIAAFGGWFAIEGIISVGTIQAFITYSKQFTRPINEIANQYAQLQSAIAGAERVFEIMDSEPEDEGGNEPFEIEDVKGDIDFKDVKFSYVEGEPVLTDFDLWVRSGQKIAIVGATGSGKTTVINLLTRFYDVDGGVITLDGQDIRSIPKHKLRGSIGMVLQDTVIFTGTIAQNIRYGRIDATDEEVIAAAKLARVDDFASKLADGYDTMLTEGGSNLSQGQRQLIAIARAVLADPKILILDEATSSIDTRTEMHIQAAMIALMKGRTSLIIAHRLSTIRDADKIVVLAGGRVVEAGDHEELLEQRGAYFDLYQSQFAGIAT
ncbi:MAG: ABC transporter ATP-binding protein [Oscillospiraceae bacterium]|nr:ABC transporter ATP-binding protein [Oscillospiraceae bacterium]